MTNLLSLCMWLVKTGRYFLGYNLLLKTVNFSSKLLLLGTEKCIECHQTLPLWGEGAGQCRTWNTTSQGSLLSVYVVWHCRGGNADYLLCTVVARRSWLIITGMGPCGIRTGTFAWLLIKTIGRMGKYSRKYRHSFQKKHCKCTTILASLIPLSCIVAGTLGVVHCLSCEYCFLYYKLQWCGLVKERNQVIVSTQTNSTTKNSVEKESNHF